ncbi:MAG: YhcH/YjgK/YiaL family protein [Methanoregula sp.]
MIYDTFSHLSKYISIPHVTEICKFLADHDCASLENGEYPIYKTELVFKLSRYSIDAIKNPRFEAHRQFADIHVVSAGKEMVRTVFPKDAQQSIPYNAKDDVEFFSAEHHVTDFVLEDDRFLFLAPGEIHQPAGKCDGYGGEVVKGVFKIRYPMGSA